jgi:hypothetical protein
MKKLVLIFLLFACDSSFNQVTCFQCDQFMNEERIDCHPEPNASAEKCVAKGCCWRQPITESENSTLKLNGIPFCHYPKDYPSYRVVAGGFVQNGFFCSIEKENVTFRQNEILKLNVHIIFESKSRLHVKITDPNNERYEVPVILNKKDKINMFTQDDNDYQIFVNENPFSLKVFRKSTGKLM